MRLYLLYLFLRCTASLGEGRDITKVKKSNLGFWFGHRGSLQKRRLFVSPCIRPAKEVLICSRAPRGKSPIESTCLFSNPAKQDIALFQEPPSRGTAWRSLLSIFLESNFLQRWPHSLKLLGPHAATFLTFPSSKEFTGQPWLTAKFVPARNSPVGRLSLSLFSNFRAASTKRRPVLPMRSNRELAGAAQSFRPSAAKGHFPAPLSTRGANDQGGMTNPQAATFWMPRSQARRTKTSDMAFEKERRPSAPRKKQVSLRPAWKQKKLKWLHKSHYKRIGDKTRRRVGLEATKM